MQTPMADFLLFFSRVLLCQMFSEQILPYAEGGLWLATGYLWLKTRLRCSHMGTYRI